MLRDRITTMHSVSRSFSFRFWLGLFIGLFCLGFFFFSSSTAEAARRWSSGFELNSTTANVEWSNVQGSASVQSVITRSGNYAGRINPTNGQGRFYYTFVRDLGLEDPLYFRVYMYFASLPTDEATILLFTDYNNRLGEQVFLTVDQNGDARFYEDGRHLSAPELRSAVSGVFQEGKWYRVEVNYDAYDSVTLRVDGEDKMTFVDDSIEVDWIHDVYFGVPMNAQPNMLDLYIDDIAINDNSGTFQNSYPGPGSIRHMLVDGLGDTTTIYNQTPSSGSYYDKLDETSPDDSTTYLSTSTNNIGEFNLQSPSSAGIPGASQINLLQVGIRWYVSRTFSTYRLRLKALSGGAIEEGISMNTRSSSWRTNDDDGDSRSTPPMNYSLSSVVLPGTSDPWTVSDLATAQIGFEDLYPFDGGRYPRRVTTFWLLVEYLTPDIADYINGSEPTLDYEYCGTTGCGARVSTGVGDQAVTIYGEALQTIPVGLRALCTSGVGTGCIRIGAYTIPDSYVESWTPTAITFRIPSTITSYGGSATSCGSGGLCVRMAGVPLATLLEFHTFPRITSSNVTAAREESSVTFTGTRFGSSSGAVQFVGGFGSEVANVSSWNDTSIAAVVPTSIADDAYFGDIRLTRNATFNSKTALRFGSDNFRILPRVQSLIPSSGAVGNVIQVLGDHFCQTVGACPSSGNRSNATNNVAFGGTYAQDNDFVSAPTPPSTVVSGSFATQGPNRLFLATVSIRNSTGQTVSSVSGGGLSWVKVAEAANGTNVRLEIWRSFAPSIFNGTVTASLNAPAHASIIVSAYRDVNTTGTSGLGAVGSFFTGLGTSTSPLVSLATSSENSLVVSSLVTRGVPAVLSGGAQTLVQSVATGGTSIERITSAHSRRNSASASSSQIISNYTLGETQPWAMISLEIKR